MPLVSTSFSSFVPNNYEELKLADYLIRRFSYHSPEHWLETISQDLVQVNGVVSKADTIVRAGDKVSYLVKDHPEPDLPEEVEEIYRNDEFLIAGKSAGVPVSRTGEVFYNTFANQLNRLEGESEVQMLHRLDRETSGLILCSRNPETTKRYQKHLPRLLQRKFYLAVVRGPFSNKPIFLDAPLREDRDADPAPAIRSQMFVKADGKACQTDFYKVIGDQPTKNKDCFSLVLCEIHTGRKHQIRAHLAHLGHPIVGDKIYDFNGRFYLKMMREGLKRPDYKVLGADDQCLHSWTSQVALPGEVSRLFRSQILGPYFKRYLKRWPHWEALAIKKLREIL